MEDNNTQINNDLEYVRTTIYIPRKLQREAKFKAALANTSVSNLITISLQRILREMMVKKGKL